MERANGIVSEKRPNAKFENGASRSHHAPMYELLPKAAVDRLVKRLELGAEIHGANNWRKGGAEFIAQTKRHLVEHLLQYIEGDTTDDHLSAILCNAAFLAHFEANPPTSPALNEFSGVFRGEAQMEAPHNGHK